VSPTVSPTGPCRVLIVDDEPDFASALAERLRRRGFAVQTAGDGPSALAAAAATPPEVVILDVRMPGEDGIATLGRLRRAHPRVEIILLTGHATVTSGIDGMRLGAFDYLTKPVEIDELVARIQAAWEKSLGGMD
jgi:DNA-binding response OmpR family regulator